MNASSCCSSDDVADIHHKAEILDNHHRLEDDRQGMVTAVCRTSSSSNVDILWLCHNIIVKTAVSF